MGTVKSEQKKEGKEEHMKIKETPEQTAKQLVMEQEVNMQAEIKRKTAKEEYTNMQKEEIQQGFKMLEYFDELAKEGKFENYIEKSKKKPGEAKEEELDIAPMLSHPIGMAGWPDHDSTKLYPQEAHYLDQTYNKDGSPVKLLNPDHNVLTTLKETYQILMFYKGVGDEKSMKKAHMLAYLIHMVGDMHQPLHMITRCKSNGDICDNGGSEFFISGLTTTFRKADCLHELWDQAMLKFPNSRSVKEFAKEYTNAAKDLIKKLDKTMSEQQLAIDNLILHTKEMFEAGKHAYDEIEKDLNFATFLEENPIGTKRMKLNRTPPKPPNSYIENGHGNCDFFIMVAGRRLGHLLKNIYFANHPGEKRIIP